MNNIAIFLVRHYTSTEIGYFNPCVTIFAKHHFKLVEIDMVRVQYYLQTNTILTYMVRVYMFPFCVSGYKLDCMSCMRREEQSP